MTFPVVVGEAFSNVVLLGRVKNSIAPYAVSSPVLFKNIFEDSCVPCTTGFGVFVIVVRIPGVPETGVVMLVFMLVFSPVLFE